ncbi:MAG: aminotransferase class V-fold PLP-dependent enzyme [Gammaproteobacteria bacterium]|nr:aminotransferase class V-fold PLP-dependent enzyme [Gammaproteobacteria bacterium]
MSDALIYLDYAATTPTAPEVMEAMRSCLGAEGTFANPSSLHIAGRQSALVVDRSRKQLADLLNTRPDRLIFTSGATESDNLAIRGAAMARAGQGKHLITMRTEHKAVTDTFRHLEKEGFDITWLVPGADGVLPLRSLEAACRDDTQLVSVMHVNNETGVIQDIQSIGAICRERNVLFHTDAAQSVGKLDIDLDKLPVDLLSLTAHKFYGPQGVGALYIADRPGIAVFPILYGGGQERRLRPGTLPVHLICGIGAAAELAVSEKQRNLSHVTRMRDRLRETLDTVPGIRSNGDPAAAYPGILNVSVGDVDGESLMLALEPLCVASGSACNSSSAEPSHVLRALGCTDIEAEGAVRFSFGRNTTEAEVDRAAQLYCAAVGKLRGIAPAA